MLLIHVETSVSLPTAHWQISADSLNQASFQERKLWQELSSVIRPVGTGTLVIFVLFKHRFLIVTNHQNKRHLHWRQGKKKQQKHNNKTVSYSFSRVFMFCFSWGPQSSLLPLGGKRKKSHKSTMLWSLPGTEQMCREAKKSRCWQYPEG